MITVLSGGTGTPKLLQGLKEVIDQEDISVIVNTAEDERLSHGYLSPDIDTVMYTFAGIINDRTWYGIKGDTFHTHRKLLDMGIDEYMNIGDQDRETHIIKGRLLEDGKTLTEAVEIQKDALGIKAGIYPMTDDRVRTVILTPEGEMNLHEYLIKHDGIPDVLDISFDGIKEAEAGPGALEAVKESDGIIIGPSNPISSIMPIISIRELREEIVKKKEKTIAVSPIVKNLPVSGPADRFMEAWGIEPSSKGVADLYRDLAGFFVVDRKDEFTGTGRRGRGTGDIGKGSSTRWEVTNTIMKTIEDKKALSRFLLEKIGVL